MGHMIEVEIFRAATAPGSAKEPVLARGRIVRRDGNLQTEK
jgi:hypothetical protein